MLFMNDFLQQHWDGMRTFLQTVSSLDSEIPTTSFDGYVDLPLRLAVLHCLLVDIIHQRDQVGQRPVHMPPQRSWGFLGFPGVSWGKRDLLGFPGHSGQAAPSAFHPEPDHGFAGPRSPPPRGSQACLKHVLAPGSCAVVPY